MKIPNKVRTYTFWVGLSSAVVILVQSIGKLFGLQIDAGIIDNVIMSICGVLVVLGIVTKGDKPTGTPAPTDEQLPVDNQIDIADNDTKDDTK